MDHIVELQLVVAALNRLQLRYSRSQLRKLVDFFNGEGNQRELKSTENRKKGAAVRRLIAESPSVQGDRNRIQPIRDRWHRKLKGEIPEDFSHFIDELNNILKRRVML